MLRISRMFTNDAPAFALCWADAPSNPATMSQNQRRAAGPVHSLRRSACKPDARQVPIIWGRGVLHLGQSWVILTSPSIMLLEAHTGSQAGCVYNTSLQPVPVDQASSSIRVSRTCVQKVCTTPN